MRFLKEYYKSFGYPPYDPGPVDGDFGPLTDTAVRALQADYVDFDGNPLVVDGVVGEKTSGSSLELKKSFQHPQLNEEARRYRTCVGGRTPHPQGGVLFVEVAYGSQPKRTRKSPPFAGFWPSPGNLQVRKTAWWAW